jgi:hypothetical protein
MTSHDDVSPLSTEVAGDPGVPDPPRTTLEREDGRWAHASKGRDWIILAVLVAAYLAWTLTVYFFEPGIR